MKLISQLKYKLFIYPRYILKRHFFNQILTGDFGKIFHYIKIIIKNKFFGYPRLAIIETGTTCNLNCATCPTPRHLLGRPASLMKPDDFKQIVDKVKDFVHIVLLYNTNEPLLNPDLPEMIKYADKSNLYTMFSTNAMLLGEKKTNDILNSGLDEILLCLDGMTKDSYETFRAGANFETVVKNIKYFCLEKKRRRLTKPFVELQFIVTQLNQDQIPEIKQFANDLSVDRLRTKSLAIGEYAYAEAERRELIAKFLPTRNDAKTCYKKDDKGLTHKKQSEHCVIARDQVSILTDGRMVICCYDIKGAYVYGDLFKKSFKEIWFNPEVVLKRRLAEKRGHALCNKCESY